MSTDSSDCILPESPSNSCSELHVLTLNCWGIPFSPDQSARIQAIGRTLAQMDLDIVGLQEVYLEEDREVVRQEVASAGLVHSAYFRSSMLGSGLYLLSRFPIEDVSFLRFRLSGHPQDLRRPDYYVGKGVGRARLIVDQGPIDVYNAHLIAPYLEIGEDYYFSHRVAQAYEMASYINTMSHDTPVIVTCDLNSTPERLTYKTCKGLAGLEDSYRIANPTDSGITVTTDIPYIQKHEPERMDYIFCRSGMEKAFRVQSSQVVMKTVAPEVDDRILAYSDHYGVYTVLELGLAEPGTQPQVPGTIDLTEATSALKAGLKKAQDQQTAYQFRTSVAAFIVLLVSVLKSKRQISRREALRRLAAILITGAILVAGTDLFLAFRVMEKEIEAFRDLLAEIEVVQGSSLERNHC